MAILTYKIHSKNLNPDEVTREHPIHQTYCQPNQAWAALRKWTGLNNDQLKELGYRVKLDVDESELATAAAEVVIEQAPVPGIFRRLLSGLFKRKG